MADKSEHYHNRGEQDASKGEYNPPWDISKQIVSGLLGQSGECDRMARENDAYNAGWRNTNKQKNN